MSSQDKKEQQYFQYPDYINYPRNPYLDLPPKEVVYSVYKPSHPVCGDCGQHFLSDEYYVKHRCPQTLKK